MTDSPSTEALNPAARALLDEIWPTTTVPGAMFKGPSYSGPTFERDMLEARLLDVQAQAHMRGMDQANGLNEAKARDLLAAVERAAAQTATAVEALRELKDAAQAFRGNKPYRESDATEQPLLDALKTARALLSDLSAASANRDAEIAERAVQPWRQALMRYFEGDVSSEDRDKAATLLGWDFDPKTWQPARALTTQEADSAGEGS